MALHAVDDLSDAYRASRDFLLPVELGRWLRLAVLSLFVAGGSGGGAPPNGAQYSLDAGEAFGPGAERAFEEVAQVLQANLGIIVVLIAVVIAISLVLAWVAATFEFAFLRSLQTDSIEVRAYTRALAGKGTRLFAFRVLFGLGLAAVMGSLLLLALAPLILGGSRAPIYALVILAPVLFVVGLVAAVVYVLTTAFVVPIMLLEDRGLLSAWRRFWATLRTEWLQFLVYLLVGVFVMIVFGIVIGIVTAVLGVVVVLPFAIVYALFFFGTGVAFNPLLLGALGVPILALLLAVGALVQVPFQTYLRYWALLVLGDVDEDLDLIPDQRAAIRDETPT